MNKADTDESNTKVLLQYYWWVDRQNEHSIGPNTEGV